MGHLCQFRDRVADGGDESVVDEVPQLLVLRFGLDYRECRVVRGGLWHVVCLVVNRCADACVEIGCWHFGYCCNGVRVESQRTEVDYCSRLVGLRLFDRLWAGSVRWLSRWNGDHCH